MTTRLLGSAGFLVALVVAGCSDPAAPPAGQGGQGSGGQGSGGSGGAGPVAGCPTSPDDLISDFKTDNSIAAADGRQGGWYVYGDDATTAMFSPPKTDPYPIDTANGNTNCSGAGSIHLKGTGFAKWGAALGTDFKPSATPKPTYNASKYRGIAFWAKGAAPIKHVQVKFPDINQDPDAALVPADKCIYTAGSAYNCSPYVVVFGAEGTAAPLWTKYATYQIDTTWKRFEVLFADAQQDPGNPGFKTPPADKLDVAHLTGIAIQVNANYDAAGLASANDFEIWVDDVTFIQ